MHSVRVPDLAEALVHIRDGASVWLFYAVRAGLSQGMFLPM